MAARYAGGVCRCNEKCAVYFLADGNRLMFGDGKHMPSKEDMETIVQALNALDEGSSQMIHQWLELDLMTGGRISVRLDQITSYEPHYMHMKQDKVKLTRVDLGPHRHLIVRHPYFDVREAVNEMNNDDRIQEKSISRQPITHGDGGEIDYDGDEAIQPE